jgi:hypothetical protein
MLPSSRNDFRLLGSEDKGTTIFRNFGSYLTVDAVGHFRRLDSSETYL